MKKITIALLLLSACSSSSEEPQQGGNASAPAAGRQAPEEPDDAPPELASLTGLYEGDGSPKHQMCVVRGEGGARRFGLVVWGDSQHSCSGSGTVTREGDKLRLAMAGDSACTIEATISGETVKLPADVPEGCSYYCGARARLGGAELTQAGTTTASAMQAKDLVGEPLCEGEGG